MSDFEGDVPSDVDLSVEPTCRIASRVRICGRGRIRIGAYSAIEDSVLSDLDPAGTGTIELRSRTKLSKAQLSRLTTARSDWDADLPSASTRCSPPMAESRLVPMWASAPSFVHGIPPQVLWGWGSISLHRRDGSRDRRRRRCRGGSRSTDPRRCARRSWLLVGRRFCRHSIHAVTARVFRRAVSTSTTVGG